MHSRRDCGSIDAPLIAIPNDGEKNMHSNAPSTGGIRRTHFVPRQPGERR
jgi:hypothetical protein